MSTHDPDKPARTPAPAAGAATPSARQPAPVRQAVPSQQAVPTRQPVPPQPAPAPPNATTPARVPLRPATPAVDRGATGGSTPAAATPSESAVERSPPSPDPPLSLVEDAPLPSDLALEDTAALRKRGVGTTADPISGYNPYDTGPPAGGRPPRDAPATPAKRKDLRKLSQWIQTQRRVEDLKKDGDEGGN